MKTSKTISRISFLSAIAAGSIFVYAGVLKALDVAGLTESIAAYQILPIQMVPFVAATLPYVEIGAGLLVLLRPWRGAALATLAVLNGVFMVALSSLIIRGINIDCGCFSSATTSDPTSVSSALLRDLVIMAVIAFASLSAVRRESSGT
ncbi:hypothetical protein GSUB_16935 (plasmid) [Geoalkalibacter subterraneus]|uniref:Methylamine utilisation protein MauE domain-containing protein n=1 Tax=Geoalkalibacter subterraneus TaxID=483547 RepID=A0A0B5FLJ3_9BACT|nr:hypothetical protein GSUB_16935 [Geoalkalibacter subterraneus]